MADSDHPKFRIETEPGSSYALTGKIMLIAIVILFAVVVFMGSLHLYARWYLVRLRRRQARRRRNRRSVPRSHIVVYTDSRAEAADRGLDLKVLNSLPVFLYSAADTGAEEQPPPECAVCLSEFEDKETGRLLPKCNHSFHIDCIDMWFHSHSTCPLCRSPVEHVPERVMTAAVKPTPPENESVPGPSSASGDDETPSLGSRRKGLDLVGVRIEVPPRTELLNELTQSSPASRLLSLRRILSMGRKSPIGCGGITTPHGSGTSGGTTVEGDLESGLSEVTRVQTPI